MEEKKREISEIAKDFWRHIDAIRIPKMDVIELLDLMDYYSRSGMDYEAELCRRMATRIDPDNFDVAITNVHWEVDNGDWTDVHTLSDHLTEGYDVQLFDVERWIKMGNPDEALTFVKKSLPTQCQLEEYDFIYDAALLFHDYGYSHHSNTLVKRIPQDYIDYQNVCELLVDNYAALGQLDQAKSQLDAMIDATPFNATHWIRLAQLQLQHEHYNEAADAAEYALAIDQDSDALRCKNYAYLRRKGGVAGFLSSAAAAQDYAACVELADFCFAHSDYKQALEGYKVAAVFCPRGHRDREYLLIRMCLCLIHFGETENVVDHIRSISSTGGDVVSAACEVMQADLECYRTEVTQSLTDFLLSLHLIKGHKWNTMAALFSHYQCYDPVAGFWKHLFAHPDLLLPSYAPDLAKARLYWGLSD